MHFLWFMHLFIFVLFSLFSSGKADFYSDDSEENEHTNNIILQGKTTRSLISEELDDYDEERETKETTKSMEKTTKHHLHSNDDDVEYYHDDEEETENEKVSSTIFITTTSSSSSSSKIRLSTRVITETTNNKAERLVTSSIWPFSTVLYDINKHMFWTTTIDSEQIAAFLAKTNRSRLFLKIFTITIVIGMSSLSIALITIHIVRKTRRYHGYRLPANASSDEQSKYLDNIKV